MEIDQASKEHDLPLVRWRRRGRGTVLHQDLSRFIRWRSARGTGRLSVRQERRFVASIVHLVCKEDELRRDE